MPATYPLSHFPTLEAGAVHVLREAAGVQGLEVPL